MSTTKTNLLMSPTLTLSVQTNVDATTPSSHDISSENTNRDEWQDLIDYQLIEWGKNADQFNDEGVEPPTRDTIQRAIGLAKTLSDAGLPAANNIVLDANGGIIFERRENNLVAVFHVWDDGVIEYQRFHGTCLIERRPL